MAGESIERLHYSPKQLLDGPDLARNAGFFNAAAADGFLPDGLV